MCKVRGICNILWTMAFQVWCKRSLNILSYCYSRRTFLTFFQYMKEPQTSFIQTHIAVTYIRLGIKCKCPVSDRWLLSQSTSIRQAINKNDWAVCLFYFLFFFFQGKNKPLHFTASLCTRFNRSILYILDLVSFWIICALFVKQQYKVAFAKSSSFSFSGYLSLPIYLHCLHSFFFCFSLYCSLSLSAMNLLGLNWQLKPVVGPMLNNGLGAGLPSNSDVATAPSGGRGEQHSLTARCGSAPSFRWGGCWDWQKISKGKKPIK